MGLGWCAYRAYYSAANRCGILERRCPPGDWSDWPLADLVCDPALADPIRYLEYRRAEDAPRFLFDTRDREWYRTVLEQWDAGAAGPVEEADAALKGRFRLFSHHEINAGFPPDWHRNYFTGERAPATSHWSRISTVAHGDIKCIWELSRFSWAYALARAYWRTGDERYPEAFWLLLEDWYRANLPNRGVNWKCGQEIALRLMACCFALYSFLSSPATTPERMVCLAQLVAVSGRRMRANIGYALSQRNNHGMSEATGLWTIGLLFPELRQAQQWRRLGKELLDQQAAQLIYEDGTCSQHSVIYERLMVHLYLWSTALGEANGHRLSSATGERLSAAGNLLFQLQDQTTGELPLYGSSDGALVLPLAPGGYLDFRPVVQAAGYFSSGRRPLEAGPWDETLLWLWGPEALATEPAVQARDDLRAKSRGYYTLRSGSGHAFFRCGSPAPGHRVGHQDQLHVDIWWRGQNIAVDAGTYSYNPPEPRWRDFSRAHTHSVADVDGTGQSDKVGVFLSLPWPTGRLTASLRSQRGGLAYLEGRLDAYERLADPVTYQRGLLRIGPEHWLILDRLIAANDHEYRLHWLLGDWPYEWDGNAGCLLLHTPSGPYQVLVGSTDVLPTCSVARAEEASSRGWRAPHYLSLEPALSLSATVRAPTVTFWSLLGPPAGRVAAEHGCLRVDTPSGRLTALLAPMTQSRLLSRVCVTHGAFSVREAP